MPEVSCPSLDHETSQELQALAALTEGRERVEGLLQQLTRQDPCALQPEQTDVGGLVRCVVLARGLAELKVVAGGVKDVVHDLEGQADRGAVAIQACELVGRAPAQQRTAPDARGEERARLRAMEA